jgi:hypothetical protein
VSPFSSGGLLRRAAPGEGGGHQERPGSRAPDGHPVREDQARHGAEAGDAGLVDSGRSLGRAGTDPGRSSSTVTRLPGRLGPDDGAREAIGAQVAPHGLGASPRASRAGSAST